MTNKRVEVRSAEQSDASSIAALFSSSFRREVAGLLIFGCKGASEYIRLQLKSVTTEAESVFFVATSAGSVIGASELRRRPGGLFLNYIAVSKAQRAKGVASTLLSEAIRMSGIRSGWFGLDVLDDNDRARQWYLRLGFTVTESRDFVEVHPPSGEPEGPVFVSGLPQADLVHERFGFSTFGLEAASGSYQVGRLGDTWFRITELAMLDKPEVFDVLRELEPGRRILAVIPVASINPERVVQRLARVHKMEADISTIAASLAHDR